MLTIIWGWRVWNTAKNYQTVTKRHELGNCCEKMAPIDLLDTGLPQTFNRWKMQYPGSTVKQVCRYVVSTVLGVFSMFLCYPCNSYKRKFYHPQFTEEKTWPSLSTGEHWGLNQSYTWLPVWTARLENTTGVYSPERLTETLTTNWKERKGLTVMTRVLIKFFTVFCSDFQKSELHSLDNLPTLP